MSARNHGILGALRSLLRTPIPPDRHGAFAFGWLLLVLFFVQAATGILLSLYYEPSSAAASASVRLIMRDVHAGWLVRGIHHWNANLIVSLGLLQMLRILVTTSYRGRAASSWAIGIVLLVLTFAEAFSGELLIWDNDAFWSLTHALNGIERIPLVGPLCASVVRGGGEVTAYTLSRIHTAHVMLLPWVATVLVAVHLWMFARRRFEESSR